MNPSGGNSGAVRLLVVDDHALFRSGLARLLAADPRFEVAGEATNGREMLAMLSPGPAPWPTSGLSPGPSPAPSGVAGPSGAAAPHDVAGLPDVVLLDIDMPVMGGVEAAAEALARYPDLRIITLSMHGEQEYYFRMVSVGVKGFLVKNSAFDEVVAAIMAVMAGGNYFSQELLRELAPAAGSAAWQGMPQAPGPATASPAVAPAAHGREALSPREMEILLLICQGESNHQIADRLFLSKRTVDNHRANILEKTGCKNTASLVVYAIKNSLIVL